MVHVTSALSLPEVDKKYEVVVRLNEKELKTGDPAFNKGNYNRWNWRNKEEDGIYEAPYINLDDLGSVFIYLKAKMTIGSDKYVCFYRSSVKKWQISKDNDVNKIKWIQFKPDRAIGEVGDYYKAGIIGLRLAIVDVTPTDAPSPGPGPFDWSTTVFSKRIQKRPGNLKVRAYIF